MNASGYATYLFGFLEVWPCLRLSLSILSHLRIFSLSSLLSWTLDFWLLALLFLFEKKLEFLYSSLYRDFHTLKHDHERKIILVFCDIRFSFKTRILQLYTHLLFLDFTFLLLIWTLLTCLFAFFVLLLWLHIYLLVLLAFYLLTIVLFF